MHTLAEPAAAAADPATHDPPRAALCWRLRRNLAIPPRVFMLHMGAAGGLSCAIGAGFWLAGYPLVFGFCACQALALAAAVVCHAAHACDGEQLLLAGDTLEVRSTRGFRSTTVRLHCGWTRLELTPGAQPPALCSGRMRVPVGVYLAEPQRRLLAADLRRALAHARARTGARERGLPDPCPPRGPPP